MLGKLLKYEFQSIGRLLLVIYAAVIAAAFVLGGLMRRYVLGIGSYVENKGAALITTTTLIYVILLAALVIITLIMIIQRFYKNLLGQEGYLMHTLPVPEWMLVASKAITALVWALIGIAVSAVSLVIILAVSGETEMFAAFVPSDGDGTALSTGLVLVGILAMVLSFYFSMAVGNLVNKHKFAVAVLVFIGIMIIEAILQSTVIGSSVIAIGFSTKLENTTGVQVRELVFQIILAAAFFTGTTWILQKHLNLA